MNSICPIDVTNALLYLHHGHAWASLPSDEIHGSNGAAIEVGRIC
jgi:hypothetical protein